ncbi:MAG: hypothetical protein H6659_14470 [Ardenticatenaceae bacterium]|nr:hypothetical protein [Ardenticatenaceae bacterium]MCB8986802.1 hypothetical protein [Ardenticatenaceae bacterium]
MSRLEWILGIVLLLLLVAAGGLAVSLWRGSGARTAVPQSEEVALAAEFAQDVAPTRTTPQQTAKHAYVVAQEAAQAWQSDAVLVSATATWPQGLRAADLAAGKETWGFIFYSPAINKTAVVSVTEGTATLSPRDTERQLSLFDVTSWQRDSAEATEIFLNNGGAGFIEREGITVYSMTLSMNDSNGNGRVEWLMSMLSTQNGHSLTIRIDAASGELLEVIDAT